MEVCGDKVNIVLNHWTNAIKPFSINLNEVLIKEIDYQFYHRTSSACFDSKKAIVIYQLFYEIETKSDLDEYIKNLKKYVQIINPNKNLTFYIWTVETKLKENITGDIGDFFGQMKFQDIYEFQNDEIINITNDQ